MPSKKQPKKQQTSVAKPTAGGSIRLEDVTHPKPPEPSDAKPNGTNKPKAKK